MTKEMFNVCEMILIKRGNCSIDNHCENCPLHNKYYHAEYKDCYCFPETLDRANAKLVANFSYNAIKRYMIKELLND